jgi:hypothetical protein
MLTKVGGDSGFPAMCAVYYLLERDKRQLVELNHARRSERATMHIR